MISTHVLDTSLGHPAQGIPVELAIFEGKQEDTKKAESETRHWRVIQSDVTNDDGRISFNCDAAAGTYRLKFKVEDYFKQQQLQAFFVVVPVIFSISDTSRRYHVPLLLNPFGYNTYRGS